MQTRLLAIETSSRWGSAAAGIDGEVAAATELPAERRETDALPARIDEMLKQLGWRATDLRHLYVSIGPGSFTGLRVAVAVGRALALAQPMQIVAVPTTEVLADNARALDDPPADLAVILDAKRGQVFAGTFRRQDRAGAITYDAVEPAHLADPAELLRGAPRPLAVLGEGCRYHRDVLAGADGVSIVDPRHWRPRAEAVLRLGWRMARQGRFTAARDLVPLYIRRPEAEEKWRQLHG